VLNLAQDILTGNTIRPDHALSEEFLIQKALENYPHPSKDPPIFEGGRFCILSPLREGPFGVNALNEQIFGRFYNRMKPHDLLAVPILITKTDYEAQLYNGETGILWRTREKPLYAEFSHRKIPAAALPPYELGYVLSVHKSQGSEFDHVVVAVPPGSEAFGREVLYTAVTRAKLSVTLCADAAVLQKTASQSSRRHSGLKIRWSEK
jgi:exodeoxyribonuclease V alpha subunit